MKQPRDIGDLDFASFVALALERAKSQDDEIDTEALELVLTLHRATSTVVYDLESSVHRPAGWTWSGFRLLFALWIAEPLDAKDAARISGMSRQTVSSLAKTLERDGHISRSPSVHDRRAVVLELTPSGRQAIGAAFRAHNVRERAWADLLTPRERRTMVSVLGKLLTSAPDLEVRRRR
ncbi:MAG: MarR family transcriptional regulator [Actinomycetota bacterium]|nr:MarR family transcriptional regulator [Actinomycetota bacterium]